MKKFTEHQVVISKEEYEFILAIQDKFQKAFDEKKTILFVDFKYVGMGYTRDEFYIINPGSLVEGLNKEIKEYQNTISQKYQEIYKLKDELEKAKKRKWWWL